MIFDDGQGIFSVQHYSAFFFAPPDQEQLTTPLSELTRYARPIARLGLVLVKRASEAKSN